jgi:hypothetical protein
LTGQGAQEGDCVGQSAGHLDLGLVSLSAASADDERASCFQDVDGPSQVGEEHNMTGDGAGLRLREEAGGELPCFRGTRCACRFRCQGPFEGPGMARDDKEAIGQGEGGLKEAPDGLGSVPQQLDYVGGRITAVRLQQSDSAAVRSSGYAHALLKQPGDLGLEVGAQLDKEGDGGEDPFRRGFFPGSNWLVAPS